MLALAAHPDPAGLADSRLRESDRAGGRGVHPVGHPGAAVRPHRHRGHRTGPASRCAPVTRSGCSTARPTVTSPRSTGHSCSTRRSPNPHLGFWRRRPHFCLGQPARPHRVAKPVPRVAHPAECRVRGTGLPDEQLRARHQAPPGCPSGERHAHRRRPDQVHRPRHLRDHRRRRLRVSDDGRVHIHGNHRPDSTGPGCSRP